jgi:hypothetical protein
MELKAMEGDADDEGVGAVNEVGAFIMDAVADA